MRGLAELARMWGVQPSYTGADGARHVAPAGTVLAILKELGADGDLREAARRRRDDLWARTLEPVTASWEGSAPAVVLRTSAAQARATIRFEDGTERSWTADVRALAPLDRSEERGRVAVSLTVPEPVPPGYHTVEVDGAQTMLVRAPRRVFQWTRRSWGAFMPLHALRTERDWGCGDLGDLRALMRWVGSMGGEVVATLPLLARASDDPSPYAPVSRLFWDETWLDLGEAPPGAPRDAPTFEHERVRALKHQTLRAIARPDAADPDAADPELLAYARFRAAGAAHGADRSRWPANAMDAADPDEVALHVTAQRMAEDALRSLRAEPVALLFDMPVGVRTDGFDPWRHPDAFALGAHVGAPSDSFFNLGQDWEFAPLHPERIREQRYAYPIACLRALMRHARILRVDHVMGLHRLWWIPAGAPPTEGAYVRYRPDEWYAILSLESHRNQCAIVGEDLGTVPREVRRAMGAHGVMRTYVAQEQFPDTSIPSSCVAGLNTHDMPTFAAFWRALDADRRERLAKALGAPDDEHTVLRELLEEVARSPARIAMVALDDLWGETEQHNVPGAPKGFGNWRRRARYPVEQIPADAVETLRQIGAMR